MGDEPQSAVSKLDPLHTHPSPYILLNCIKGTLLSALALKIGIRRKSNVSCTTQTEFLGTLSLEFIEQNIINQNIYIYIFHYKSLTMLPTFDICHTHFLRQF